MFKGAVHRDGMEICFCVLGEVCLQRFSMIKIVRPKRRVAPTWIANANEVAIDSRAIFAILRAIKKIYLTPQPCLSAMFEREPLTAEMRVCHVRYGEGSETLS